eukprot:CAMPEP_0172765540 /NCGR_PEP_ID=MMETSP1074-20121228/179491_1 /TAXON_ID=2916 /ORGANISM="Ceratium fusus, Strain PA161109" /LENGTH=44 /DNA_ID= /DNA_START= /DNA_END= /DNA_ORIENTATION=
MTETTTGCASQHGYFDASLAASRHPPLALQLCGAEHAPPAQNTL